MIDISLNWLDRIIESINFEKLPHGLIINGPNGIGKEFLSREIASRLLLNKTTKTLDKELFNSNNHPDFFMLDKEQILLKHITLREKEWDDELGQRNVNDFLSVTPSIAINKVALILNGQTMKKESQNALLKSLEEPAPNTFIIITTNRPRSLYKTIYSRCQVINIPPLSNDDLNEWLLANGITDFKSHDFPSYKTPLRIIDDISNDQQFKFKDFINVLTNFLNNNSDQLSVIKSLNNLDIDKISKLNFMVEFLKIILKSKLLSENLSGIYKDFNNANFNNLKLSNTLNDLNNTRAKYYEVPQINEDHVLNYYLSELKNSIKI